MNISSYLVRNENGSLIFTWRLRHTGGVQKDLIEVDISCHDTSTELLYLSCTGNACLLNDLTGLALVGSVQAGIVYNCTITISNPQGSVSQRFNDIAVTEGNDEK